MMVFPGFVPSPSLLPATLRTLALAQGQGKRAHECLSMATLLEFRCYKHCDPDKTVMERMK